MAAGKDPLVRLAEEEWKGLAVLIGNDYKKCITGQIKSLEGPLKDLQCARRVFFGFGGLCIMVENKSANETKEVIRDVASKRYPCSYEWIVVVFSGHGRDEDALFANDGGLIYIQKDIIDPFQPKNALEIAKIPKLFFIDACRGTKETHGVVIPRGASDLQSRGGGGLDSLIFPPEGNMLVAFPTLPSRESYESTGQGGIWMNSVLTRLEKEDCSVTDVLHMVNQDILQYFQKKESKDSRMQQAEYRSTLIGVFKFKKLSTNPSSSCSGDDPFTRDLEGAGDIKRRDMPGPQAGRLPRAVKNNEWLQELKNVLVDQYGYKISAANYKITSSFKIPPKFQCTFSHQHFPQAISGEWRKSKQDARQSTAKKVLEYFYAELQ